MSDNLLKGLKPGDVVYFMCGGRALVEKVEYYGEAKGTVDIWFHPYGKYTYPLTGQWLRRPLDIIRVEPKPLTEAERLAKIAEILGMFRLRIDEPELTELRELTNQPLPGPLTSGMILVREEVHAALVAERDDLAARVARLSAALTPLEANTLATAVNMEMRKLHRNPEGAVMVKFEALMAKRAAGKGTNNV